MKLLQIPENTNELRDHNLFINVVKEFNIFQKNLQEYLKKIVEDEYLKKVDEWGNILKEEKYNSIKDNENYKKFFYCYKTNTLIECKITPFNINAWLSGEITSSGDKYEMSDDGVEITIIYWCYYKRARFPHIKPDYLEVKYKINLIEKSVTKLCKNIGTKKIQ